LPGQEQNRSCRNNKLGCKLQLNKNGFSILYGKVRRDGAEVTESGRLFQLREAAAGNAVSPTVDSRIDGSNVYWLII